MKNQNKKNILRWIYTLLITSFLFSGFYAYANVTKINLTFTDWHELKASELQSIVDWINWVIDDYASQSYVDDVISGLNIPEAPVICENNAWVRWIKWTYQYWKTNDYIMRYKSSGTTKNLYNSSCWTGNVNDSAFRTCMWWESVWCWSPRSMESSINYNWVTYVAQSAWDNLEWCGWGWRD